MDYRCPNLGETIVRQANRTRAASLQRSKVRDCVIALVFMDRCREQSCGMSALDVRSAG